MPSHQTSGNVVFSYLDAFDPDRAEVERLKERYKAGGLGDGVIKRRLEELLQELIRPIRERRSQLSKDPGLVREIIAKGTRIGRERTDETRNMVFTALRIGPP